MDTDNGIDIDVNIQMDIEVDIRQICVRMRSKLYTTIFVQTHASVLFLNLSASQSLLKGENGRLQPTPTMYFHPPPS